MTTNDQPTVSRRRVLAGLGAVGLASAGAGLGTTAQYSDTETYEDNVLVAGALDLMVDWQVTYTGPDGFVYVDAYPDNFINDPQDPGQLQTNQFGIPVTGSDNIQDPIFSRETIAANRSLAVDDPQVESAFRSQFQNRAEDMRPVVAIDDVKPGDSGTISTSIHLFDNPAYVWLTGDLLANREVSVTEPEAKDPDEDQAETDSVATPDEGGELPEEIAVTVWYDTDADAVRDGDESIAFEGTLAELVVVFESGAGLPLDGSQTAAASDSSRCFQPETTAYVGVEWTLSRNHANEIQTDEVVFDLGFYVEQCRHNDWAGTP